MDSAPEARANNFLLWATLRFNPNMYQTIAYPETHWGDKAYQVGYGGEQGQSFYDFIQDGELDQRSNRWFELADQVDDDGKMFFSLQC